MKLGHILVSAVKAVGLALLMHVGLSYANEAKPLADDPVAEQRLNTIAEELRCLVCQNESLAGSRADLALDLRRELRGLIKAGKSDDEIKDFMVSRYGDFVLYRPPFKPQTWLLWLAPLFLLVMGLLVLVRVVKHSHEKQNDLGDSDDWNESTSLSSPAYARTTHQKEQT